MFIQALLVFLSLIWARYNCSGDFWTMFHHVLDNTDYSLIILERGSQQNHVNPLLLRCLHNNLMAFSSQLHISATWQLYHPSHFHEPMYGLLASDDSSAQERFIRLFRCRSFCYSLLRGFHHCQEDELVSGTSKGLHIPSEYTFGVASDGKEKESGGSRCSRLVHGRACGRWRAEKWNDPTWTVTGSTVIIFSSAKEKYI